jgi:antitoxin (DNA-binding transcriptional repressor) of toxin-antitoxin stability system
MAKNVIHISEAEAASDFAAVLARVRAGAEIVIEGREPVVVIRAGEVRAGEVHSEPVRGRLLSESIALAKAHEEETGKAPVLDPDFAADLEAIIKSRKPREISSWE